MIKIITITAVYDDERRVALHYFTMYLKSGCGTDLIHPGRHPTSKVYRKRRKSLHKGKKEKKKKKKKRRSKQDNHEFNAANGIRKARDGTFMETCHDVIHYLIEMYPETVINNKGCTLSSYS